MRRICEHAGRVAPASRLRTLEAIHLATYVRARALSGDVEMLSYGDRLLTALSGVVSTGGKSGSGACSRPPCTVAIVDPGDARGGEV